MVQLRLAVDACARFKVGNIYGEVSVTTEKLAAPGLGEEAVRYRTLSRIDSGGFNYSLVTAVRIGGVIVTMEISDFTGPASSDKVATFKPAPSADESVLAAFVQNVAETQK
ncbi:hypothetical protein [Streptomyces sp. NPDC054863]